MADVIYYVNLALASGGPVLEYGVGNGRIAMPLARAGIDVVGVDQSTGQSAFANAARTDENRNEGFSGQELETVRRVAWDRVPGSGGSWRSTRCS